MRRHFRKTRRYFAERPFTSAVIVMVLIVAPGFARIEQNARVAHDAAVDADKTAKALVKTEARETIEEEIELLISCQTRNTFQRNTRVKFEHFIDAIETAFVQSADDPEQAERTRQFINQLRESVESEPAQEDRDCDENGIFDAADYLP